MRLSEKVIQSHHKASQAPRKGPQQFGLIKAPVGFIPRDGASGHRLHVLALELPQLSKYFSTGPFGQRLI